MTAKITAFFLALFSGIFFFLKFFKSAPSTKLGEFPEAETKKAEAEVQETKKELEKVAEKHYSDEEIEKKFN